MIFSLHFHFKAFPEKERERESARAREEKKPNSQSDDRRQTLSSRRRRSLVRRSSRRSRSTARSRAVTRSRSWSRSRLRPRSRSTARSRDASIARSRRRELATRQSRDHAVDRKIALARSWSRIAIVDDIFIGFVLSFFFSKHQKIFSGKFFEMQPNTWKYFPFPEISISGKYVFSRIRFTATKHSLRWPPPEIVFFNWLKWKHYLLNKQTKK